MFIHGGRIWDVDRGEATPESVYLARREFLKVSGLAGMGALGLLSCRPTAAGESTEKELRATLGSVEGSAFTPAPRNRKYGVERPRTEELVAAKYNNFYEFGTSKNVWRRSRKLTVRPWTVEIGGRVAKPRTIAIDDLIRKMPAEERLYRFRCVERWAMVVPWTGFVFKSLMDMVEPLSSAKFVRFQSFHRPEEAVGQRSNSGWTWPYYEGLSIAEAANELCFAATGIYGHDIPKQHGAPLRMVVPWKYGYKGAKSVVKIEFAEQRPPTLWNDYAPHEYGFVSNVDPNKPHPRWSQARERMLGTDQRHATLLYNGYGEYVAHLYKGDEH